MKIQTARILPTRLVALLCLIVFGFQAPHSHAQIPAAQQRERVNSAAQQLAANYDKTTGLFH
ncbi:MAG TPA: hypothetical protein VL346_06970, partial [Acidobacteriaceae bacterium]|nr:hypothetical protein [Acidobacteriaceae bacterium]